MSFTVSMSEPITEATGQEFEEWKHQEQQKMELGTITPIEVQNAVIAPYEIDRLITSGLSGKDICFMLAIRASYGDVRGVTMNGTEFCEKWGFKEDDFNLAIARLHKKGIIGAPVETVIQLELFPEPNE